MCGKMRLMKLFGSCSPEPFSGIVHIPYIQVAFLVSIWEDEDEIVKQAYQLEVPEAY